MTALTCTLPFAARYADACASRPWPLITGPELFASIVVSSAELTGEPERRLLDTYLRDLEQSVPAPDTYPVVIRHQWAFSRTCSGSAYGPVLGRSVVEYPSCRY